MAELQVARLDKYRAADMSLCEPQNFKKRRSFAVQLAIE